MSDTISINGLTLSHKGSHGVSTATVPDVCKTPTPGGPVPMPYPNVSMSGDLDGGTTTVSADGGNMISVKGSEYSRSTGDEPGTVGGLNSNVNMKASKWILYSFDVKFEGTNACRLTDKKTQNNGNTVDATGDIEAPTTPATPPGPDPKCEKILQEIIDLINTIRPPTPPGGRQQGYQGLAKRWQEFAENVGNWGKRPDGALGSKAEGHIGEYRKHQERLKKKLEEWDKNDCDNKGGGGLPELAREYADQEPQLGPGQPTEPTPASTTPSTSVTGEDIAIVVGIVAVSGLIALAVFPPAGLVLLLA